MDKAAVLNYCRIRGKYGNWVGCECVFTVVYDVLVGCTSIYRRGIKSQSQYSHTRTCTRMYGAPNFETMLTISLYRTCCRSSHHPASILSITSRSSLSHAIAPIRQVHYSTERAAESRTTSRAFPEPIHPHVGHYVRNDSR